MAEKQLTVAELMARAQEENPESQPRRRRRRSLDEGGVSVAELTGSMRKIKARPTEGRHSSTPIEAENADRPEPQRPRSARSKQRPHPTQQPSQPQASQQRQAQPRPTEAQPKPVRGVTQEAAQQKQREQQDRDAFAQPSQQQARRLEQLVQSEQGRTARPSQPKQDDPDAKRAKFRAVPPVGTPAEPEATETRVPSRPTQSSPTQSSPTQVTPRQARPAPAMTEGRDGVRLRKVSLEDDAKGPATAGPAPAGPAPAGAAAASAAATSGPSAGASARAAAPRPVNPLEEEEDSSTNVMPAVQERGARNAVSSLANAPAEATGRTESSERVERPERTSNAERTARPERPGRGDRLDNATTSTTLQPVRDRDLDRGRARNLAWEDDEDYADYTRTSGRSAATDTSINPIMLVLLVFAGLLLGVLVFLGFQYLWGSMKPIIVGVLALVATLGTVGLVRAMKTGRDGLTMTLAALAGAAMTFGPALVTIF